MRNYLDGLLAWPGRIARRLRALARRSSFERDMRDEMRFHIEMEAAELRREGVAPSEAMRRARMSFGALEAHKESGRDATGVRIIEILMDDCRHAWRQASARKGFTLAVVITLTLGIGATTTMDALARTSGPQRPPFLDANQLIQIAQIPKGCSNCRRISTASFATIQHRATTLAAASLVSDWSPILRGPDRAQALPGARVTPDFFRTLGMRPLLGRTLGPTDTVASHEHVVVLSETAWRSRFGADSTMIGRSITLDGVPFTVVGVLTGTTVYPLNTDVWAPLIMTRAMKADHHWTDFDMVARMRDDVSPARVRAELAVIANDEASADPSDMQGATFGIRPFRLWDEGAVRIERIFTAATGLVLLIACFNLSGLLLMHLTSRRRELSVRVAMGAGPGRIARQLLAETMLLATVGGVLGALLAWGGIGAIRAIMPASIANSIPGWAQFHLDARALGIAIGIGIGTGLMIGVWPAVRFARPDITKELHSASRTITDRALGRRLLVGIQVTVGVVLLSAAGLLAHSIQHLYATPTGVAPEHVLSFRIEEPPRRTGTPVDSTSMDRLMRLLEAVPGVMSAGATFALPFADNMSTNNFDIVGQPASAPNHHPYARMQPATPDYFTTLGIPIVIGRAFTTSDAADAPRVAIVNQALAQRFFYDGNPLGQTLVISNQEWRIVGVSGNVMYGQIGMPVTPEIYRPMQQWPWSDVGAAVRTTGDPATAEPAVLAAIRSFDPDLAVSKMAPLTQGFRTVLGRYWIMVSMMGAFAAIAMVISGIGLHAVISYGVELRIREFGIRMALGASRSELQRLVLGHGLRITAVGGAIGIAGALAVTPVLRAVLYDVSPGDPVTYVLVAVGACLLGIAAAYRPARRAAATDPMISLQAD